MVPYLCAASTASITASEVFGASAAKMPPVWNQRTPSSPNSFSQCTSPGRICDAAELARSEQPSAARIPKPFSVKFNPTRVLRPMPSCSRQMTWLMSTPPCRMKSSTSQPRSLSGSAVTTAARRPQHLRMARATLYSPPPSHTVNWRALRTRPKPGSKRSITSPNDTQSHFVSAAERMFRTSVMRANLLDESHGLADLRLDAGIVLGVEQFLGDQVRADAAGHDARAEPGAQRLLARIHPARRH